MVLSIVGDESADETAKRTFAVSGVVGSEEEWSLAEQAWLARTGGEVFHAADCEYARNFGLYEDLTKILAASPLAGFTVALDLQAFHELLPGVLPDTAYYKCFTDILSATTETALKFNAANAADPQSQDPPISLEFTFDHRKQSEGTSGTIYAMFINRPEWASSSVLGGRIAFDCRTNPRIQIADLLAREAMKDLDRIVSKSGRPMRKSMQALTEADKFMFIQHDRAYCEKWRAQVEQLQERYGGVHPEAYVKWLHDTGRVQNGRPHDNLTNRVQYKVWCDRKGILNA